MEAPFRTFTTTGCTPYDGVGKGWYSGGEGQYLAKNLVFPFEAEYAPETGPFSSKMMKVHVIGLGDPDDESMIDDSYGILCVAKHERRELLCRWERITVTGSGTTGEPVIAWLSSSPSEGS